MASNVFLGGASATTAQVDTLTVGGTVESNDVFSITMTGADGSTSTLDVVAGSTTIATVCTTIANAFNASTNALFTPITAVAGATTVTLTADVAGVPFKCTVTTTENGGGAADAQTFVRTATIANSHSEDWGTAANWLTGVVPVSTDSVLLDGRAANNITRGLYWQDGVALASLTIRDSFTKSLGAVGGTKLRIGATNVTIGESASDGSSGAGSSLVNLYITGATAVRVRKARGSGTSNLPATQIKLDNNASTVTVDEGSVGIGTDVYGETVTMNALTVLGGGRVEIGEGVTFSGSGPAINQTAGTIVQRCSVATINQDAGVLETAGAAAISSKANVAGTLVANGTGTIADVEVKGGGTLDLSRSTLARTVSAATVAGPGSKVLANCGIPLRITFTTGIDFVDGASTTQADMGDEVNAAYTAA